MTIGPEFLGGVLFPASSSALMTLVPWLDRTNRRVLRRFEYLEPPSQAPLRLTLGVGALTFVGDAVVRVVLRPDRADARRDLAARPPRPGGGGCAIFGWSWLTRCAMHGLAGPRFDPTQRTTRAASRNPPSPVGYWLVTDRNRSGSNRAARSSLFDELIPKRILTNHDTFRTFCTFPLARLALATLSALLLAGSSAYALAYSPVAAAQSAAPKAYIGLFKDNAVAVLDTATNQVLSTIPVPAWSAWRRHHAGRPLGLRQQ